MSRCVGTVHAVSVILAVLVGCGGEDTPVVESVVPLDYRQAFTEVRDCRENGGSHDFNRIRVLADDLALAAYRDREEPFPVGAIVLKEEYDFGDVTCSGTVLQWSVMERLPEGNDDLKNWHWQQIDITGAVVSDNAVRCAGCHGDCVAPDGYENTCTVP